jgi:hypothetical protein
VLDIDASFLLSDGEVKTVSVPQYANLGILIAATVLLSFPPPAGQTVMKLAAG